MTERLRIGYVYRDFNDSGSIPSFYRDRAERLSRDEDVVAVCSAATRAPTDAPLSFETVEPLTRSRGRLGYAVECASFAVRAARCIRRLRPDLDLVHVVGFAAPRADIVTVNAVRRAELADYFDRFEPTSRVRRRVAPLVRPQAGVVQLLERSLFRPPFPLCLIETWRVADDLQRYYGVPRTAIELIPAGIDLETFKVDPAVRTRARAELAVPDGRVVMLFVGDNFRRKGLDRAIGALAESTLLDAELWVIGGEPQEPYRRLARSLGCLAKIRFLGRVRHAELPGLYAAGDILVLPSGQDAWGQPVLEALASGKPVLASEYTGAHELLESGVNGFVLDKAGSPEQIAALLDGPLADPETRARMGERAVESARALDRNLLYERFRAAHHTAYARRLRHASERGRSR